MNKTVLITGATKGIGYATSKKLTDLGYNIIGIARLKSACDFPGKLFLADLTSIEEIKNIITEILKLIIGATLDQFEC